MTILRTEKPENKIEYTNEIVILGEEKPNNVVEERDSISISGIEKEELQTEYIDEFNNILRELLQNTIEINADLIPMECLESLTLTPEQALSLEKFFG